MNLPNESNEEKDQKDPVENNSAPEENTMSADAPEVVLSEDSTQSKGKGSLLAKQIGFSALALLFVGGALFSIMQPAAALNLLEKIGIETSEPVAVVNGEKIYADQLKVRVLQQKPVYESQGMDLSDPATMAEAESQTLEVMIREEIVSQEAEKQGLSVTEEELNEQYQLTRDQFNSDEEFQAQLAAYSFTEESLRQNLSDQLLIEKYLKNNVDENSSAVTEEEINDFYEEYKKTREDADPIEVLGPQIEQHLQQQKTDAEIARVVQELRDNADVEILL